MSGNKIPRPRRGEQLRDLQSPIQPAGNAGHLLACAIIVIVALVAFSRVYSIPFLFDDYPAIVENTHIHQLIPPTWATEREPQTPLTDRPLAALTFAVNWQFAATNPWTYHAINLAIHCVCAILIFFLLEMVLPSACRNKLGKSDIFRISFLIALIWCVHPLQTEAVAYITQRTELLMTFCYLLTLLFSIRAMDTGDHWPWVLAAGASACLGAACKESIITVPVVVLIILRLVNGHSFREVLRTNRRLMAGLVPCVLIVSVLILQGGRSETVGIQTGVRSSEYMLAQCPVVSNYLKLSLWPHPLVFDYGPARIMTLSEVWPYVACMAAFIAMVLYLTIKKSPIGWALAAMLIILLPTSSVVPISSEIGAERRMYLPLAFGLAAVVPTAAIFVLSSRRRGARRFGIMAAAFILVACIFGTSKRLDDYQSAEQIWTSSVAARPLNWRAHFNLGVILDESGRVEESLSRFREAIRIEPRAYKAHVNLGSALFKLGRSNEAIDCYRKSLEINNRFDQAHYNYGVALQTVGRVNEAVAAYRTALRLNPGMAQAHFNLAALFQSINRYSDAEAHYREAIRLRPNDADAYNNLGNVMGAQGQLGKAAQCFEKAMALNPNLIEASDNLRGVLAAIEKNSQSNSGQQP